VSEPRRTGKASSRPAARRSRASGELERVERFLREIRPDAAEPRVGYVAEIVSTALRLLGESMPLADVRLVNTSIRELRYAFSVFARHRHVRKVTTFGSARTSPEHPAYLQARDFARRIADEGYYVITGAGGGIMRACQEGAGRERSFGLNIRLPFEQKPNEIIAGDPKLVTFKYFFTRKLLFVKEADALVLFPGGFGTLDEAFEGLTLIQTGKAEPMPIVMLDEPGGQYWKHWLAYVRDHLLRNKLVSEEDFSLFKVTDSVEEAVAEITGYYRAYHSSRYVGHRLVIRLTRHPDAALLARIEREFSDLVDSGGFEVRGPLPEEDDDETRDLPRLIFHFNRMNCGRLRQLIDVLNAAAG
jgi:hypothetical protein